MKLSRVALLSLAAVLASSPSPAQDATGRVIGTTYDQQGAVIPDVRITVTNTATRESRKTTTNPNGFSRAGTSHRKLRSHSGARGLSYRRQR